MTCNQLDKIGNELFSTDNINEIAVMTRKCKIETFGKIRDTIKNKKSIKSTKSVEESKDE